MNGEDILVAEGASVKYQVGLLKVGDVQGTMSHSCIQSSSPWHTPIAT